MSKKTKQYGLTINIEDETVWIDADNGDFGVMGSTKDITYLVGMVTHYLAQYLADEIKRLDGQSLLEDLNE